MGKEPREEEPELGKIQPLVPLNAYFRFHCTLDSIMLNPSQNVEFSV